MKPAGDLVFFWVTSGEGGGGSRAGPPPKFTSSPSEYGVAPVVRAAIL